MSTAWGDFLDFFKNWPWIASGDSFGAFTIEMIIIVMIWFIMAYIAIYMNNKDKDKFSPEVPADIAAVTLSKDQLWMKIYHWIWGLYPRNICIYVSRSAFMIVWLFVTAVGGLLLLAWIVTVIWMLWQFIAVIFRSVVQGIGYAVAMPITYKLLAVLAGLVLLASFLRSQTGQIIKLWIKSKKEKHCLPIRVE